MPSVVGACTACGVNTWRKSMARSTSPLKVCAFHTLPEPSSRRISARLNWLKPVASVLKCKRPPTKLLGIILLRSKRSACTSATSFCRPSVSCSLMTWAFSWVLFGTLNCKSRFSSNKGAKIFIRPSAFSTTSCPLPAISNLSAFSEPVKFKLRSRLHAKSVWILFSACTCGGFKHKGELIILPWLLEYKWINKGQSGLPNCSSRTSPLIKLSNTGWSIYTPSRIRFALSRVHLIPLKANSPSCTGKVLPSAWTKEKRSRRILSINTSTGSSGNWNGLLLVVSASTCCWKSSTRSSSTANKLTCARERQRSRQRMAISILSASIRIASFSSLKWSIFKPCIMEPRITPISAPSAGMARFKTKLEPLLVKNTQAKASNTKSRNHNRIPQTLLKERSKRFFIISLSS